MEDAFSSLVPTLADPGRATPGAALRRCGRCAYVEGRTVPTLLLSTKQRSVETSRTVHSLPPPQPSQNGAALQTAVCIQHQNCTRSSAVYYRENRNGTTCKQQSLLSTRTIHPLRPSSPKNTHKTTTTTVQLANSSLYTAPEIVVVHVLPTRPMCK